LLHKQDLFVYGTPYLHCGVFVVEVEFEFVESFSMLEPVVAD